MEVAHLFIDRDALVVEIDGLIPLASFSGNDTHVVEERCFQFGVVQAFDHRLMRPLQPRHDLGPVAQRREVPGQAVCAVGKLFPLPGPLPQVALFQGLVGRAAPLLVRQLVLEVLGGQACNLRRGFQLFVGVLAHQGVVAVARPVEAHQGAAHQLLQVAYGASQGVGRFLLEGDGEDREAGEEGPLLLAQGIVGQAQRSLHAREGLLLQLGPHPGEPAPGGQGDDQGQGQGVAFQELDYRVEGFGVLLSDDLAAHVFHQQEEEEGHVLRGQPAQAHHPPAQDLGVHPAGDKGAAVGGQVAHEAGHLCILHHVLVVIPHQQALAGLSQEGVDPGGLGGRVFLAQIEAAEGAQGVQQGVQGRAAPAVQPQHPAGEAPALAVGHLDGQGRLADACRAPDDGVPSLLEGLAHLT